MLPDEDGLEILGKLRANKNTAAIPVIMVTAKTSELDKVKGLDLGADDYITKPFGVMELISRVKALLRRTQSAAEETKICHGEIRMDNDKHAVFVGNEPCELTFKEYELLKYLMINAGIVLSRDKIMDRYGALSTRARVGPWICTSRHCARSLGRREAASRRSAMWDI